jgi:hypothetical protein
MKSIAEVKTTSKFAGILSLCFLSITLFSCREKQTNIPDQVFKYWSGSEPPNGVRVLNGKYWESAHWSKEYVMYMELVASSEWRSAFISQNHLLQIKKADMQTSDAGTPNWFKPSNRCTIWIPSGFNQGSIYFDDSVNNRMFLHEVQL